MEQQENRSNGIHISPWEKSFDKVITPFEEFIHRQTTSGMLLMATAILALILANSALAGFYADLQHLMISISIGSWSLEKSLHHWVNDGLMALFFFVVGLELKREILVGELADLRKASLPMIAAIGGMIVPALIYLLFNPDGEAARGWGIPMATDIAFAIGALVLLAHRVPKALITFLVALAIVDDLGAVAVIAIFYTETLVYDALFIALALFGLLIMFNMAGIRRISPYAIVAIFLWYFLLKSGVHATIAGVLGAFTVPAIPKYDPQRFSQQMKNLIGRFDKSYESGKSIMNNVEMRSVVQTLENGILRVEAPLQRLEHAWHLPVAFLVVPIFALFNAGIPLQLDSLGETLRHPVTLGIGAGLIGGKFIGITLSSWLAIKLGIAQLPPDIRFTQIAGVSLLAGIGFTMAIFIAELGFAAQPEYLLMAKTGILIASLLAGIIGYVWLRLVASDK
ncbi:Na+/H+ antiporter NhaA type [hydrothermal vent metagenome]|uniref:Na+/H+ antiporter NhaA type n=1 Tax=hydrothermal vent metagenome TaxID=652676 RepID=A0A3B1AWK9_9ZZZZ